MEELLSNPFIPMAEDRHGHRFAGNSILVIFAGEEEAERILSLTKGRSDAFLQYPLPVSFVPDAIYFKTPLTYYMTRFHGYAWDGTTCSFTLHAFKPLYYATNGLLDYSLEKHGNLCLCTLRPR